jgi:hypothetical protein
MQQQPNNNNVYPVMTAVPSAPPAYPSYPQQPPSEGYAFYPQQSVPQNPQVPQRPAGIYPQGYPVELNTGYVPSQQSQHSSYDKLEELPFDEHSHHPSSAPINEGMSAGPVRVTPFGLENGTVSEEILAQDYQVTISKWFSDAWVVYKQHWIAFAVLTLFQLVVSGILPHIGPVLVYPLSYGIFIAVTHKIRHNGLMGEMKYDHLLYGYLYFLPMFLISILSVIVIFIGFFLCIIPGIYAIIALTFAIPIFLEYHDQHIGSIGSMLLSVKVINKHIVEMTLFLILNFLFMISGILLLGVGCLVTFPMSQIVLVMAFKDLFGLNPHKTTQARFTVC